MNIAESTYERAINALASSTGTDRREVALTVVSMLKQHKACKPTHIGNRGTVRIWGKQYHWAEFQGQLMLADGPTPWLGPLPAGSDR